MDSPMTIDDIKTIGVVGAGQMGRGIAQVLAAAGWKCPTGGRDRRGA